MVAIIKNNFRLQNAKEFLKNFGASVTEKNYYLFVGKPLPWGSAADVINSSNADRHPPMPQDTLVDENRIWDEMLALKKIGAGDTSLVIPRSDWRPRTVYAIFDDNDPQLYHRPTLEDVQRARNSTTAAEIGDVNLGYRKAGNFYALNSLNQLFVCLFNNNNSVSLDEPTLTGNATDLIVSTRDKYVWKYITSITSGDSVKFLTDSWIPIKTLAVDNGTGQFQVQQAAQPGEVLCAVVTNTSAAGSTPATFPHTHAPTIKITGAATAEIVTNPSQTNNSYIGYQLHMTAPSSGLAKVFNIVGYSYDSTLSPPKNTLVIAETFAEFTQGHEYPETKILPKLSVYSNGTIQPVCIPEVDAVSKQLVSVRVLTPGLRATFVSIEVNRPQTGTDSTSVLPNIRPILAPLSGLGKNPEKELGAFFVMVSTQIRYDEGSDTESPTHLADFPVQNDYRQIGILQNALRDDLVLCTADTLRATKRIKIQFLGETTLGTTGDLGFKSDEEVSLKNSSGNVIGKIKVIDFKFFDRTEESDAYQGEITFVQTPNTKYTNVVVGQQILGSASGAAATIIEVNNEELKKFNGEILYIENRRPIFRAVDQIEDIKTIIEF